MSSLDPVRARFARNEGLPFADILTEDRIKDVLHKLASGIGTECLARSRPSGDF